VESRCPTQRGAINCPAHTAAAAAAAAFEGAPEPRPWVRLWTLKALLGPTSGGVQPVGQRAGSGLGNGLLRRSLCGLILRSGGAGYARSQRTPHPPSRFCTWEASCDGDAGRQSTQVPLVLHAHVRWPALLHGCWRLQKARLIHHDIHPAQILDGLKQLLSPLGRRDFCLPAKLCPLQGLCCPRGDAPPSAPWRPRAREWRRRRQRRPRRRRRAARRWWRGARPDRRARRTCEKARDGG